jgi:REP element-mobilizing transposase RayT
VVYHIACLSKYGQVASGENADRTLKEICEEPGKRYEINFPEIGTEGDWVHFLVESAPEYSPEKIVRTIKTITAKDLYRKYPGLRKGLWGGEFRGNGYCINTVVMCNAPKPYKKIYL